MLSTSQRAPGVAVPVPGAADAVALLEHAHPQPLTAQPVQHVEAREARTDHHGVERLGRGGVGRIGHGGSGLGRSLRHRGGTAHRITGDGATGR